MKSIKMLFKTTLVILIITTVLNSCKKENTIASTRKTVVKILNGSSNITVNGIEALPNLQDFYIQVRRDVNTEADLSLPEKFKLALNFALVTASNTANSTNFIAFPSNAYTLSENFASDIVFNPGEFTKDVKFQINISLLDLTKQYAIGVSLTSVDPNSTLLTTSKDWVQAYIIKNKYDGVYSYRAARAYGADRSTTWDAYFVYGYDVHLITTGPNTVKMMNTAFGAGFLPLVAGGAASGFGGTEPNFTFATDDKITSISNPAADSRNRQFTVIPGSPSGYNSATKRVITHMVFSQNGFLPSNCFDTLTFIKKR